MVYRVTQEAITNSVNHASATELTVRVEFVEGKLRLTVKDNDTGFDPRHVNKSSEFGLTAMKERAQIVGAELVVSSYPGRGTAVELTV